MVKLLLDWVTIATSGATIDGRELKPEQLVEMASSYQPSEYTAIVNVDHFCGNFGTVQSLRVRKDSKDRVILEAQIHPNADYLAINQKKMKQFFSIEFVSDFAKTGKAYLVGLAITDTPASLGTTKCEFRSQATERLSTGAELEFDFSTVSEKNIFTYIKDLFTTTKPEEKTMPSVNTNPQVESFDATQLPEIVATAVRLEFAAQREQAVNEEIERLSTENKLLKEELAQLKEPVSATPINSNLGATEPAEELY